MGTDDSIVNSARQCYGSTGNKLADERLLTSVIKHKHTSCMEHTSLTFKVKCPIFVARQWMRHRVGCSYNERSLRYCEAQPEFYIPTDEQFANSALAYKYKPLKEWWIRDCNDHYNDYLAWVDYLPKEQARAVLPLGLYTEFVFTCNMASLMHFLELRLALSAQYEIRVYAEAILELIQEFYPQTTRALREQLQGGSK